MCRRSLSANPARQFRSSAFVTANISDADARLCPRPCISTSWRLIRSEFELGFYPVPIDGARIASRWPFAAAPRVLLHASAAR